jgi:hypothetical protein
MSLETIAILPTTFPRDCQQRGCTRTIATWCPLCERFLCLEHDPLTPVRMHDCLRGPAEDDESLSMRLRAREAWRS